jgi:hypothetical protein
MTTYDFTKREEMVMRTTLETAARELDRRTKDGFDIRLLWDPHTDRVLVAVNDQLHGESFTFEADLADALQAFHHPFAYARDDRDPLPRPAEHLTGSVPPVEEQG